MRIKNNNGVTLVSLVIIIIVLLILASIAGYNGYESIQNSKKTAFTTELQMIQAKVNNYHEKGYDVYKDLGQIITTENVSNIKKAKLEASVGVTIDENYKFFDSSEYADIDIYGVNSKTLINFETKQVISIDGINIDGEYYYTLEQLGQGLYSTNYDEEKNEGNLSFDINVEKLKNTYKISVVDIDYPGYVNKGSIKYKKTTDDYWKMAKGYSFEISDINASYEIELKDEANNTLVHTINFIELDSTNGIISIEKDITKSIIGYKIYGKTDSNYSLGDEGYINIITEKDSDSTVKQTTVIDLSDYEPLYSMENNTYDYIDFYGNQGYIIRNINKDNEGELTKLSNSNIEKINLNDISLYEDDTTKIYVQDLHINSVKMTVLYYTID